MTGIFKREFKSYFYSPLGYIFIAVMWCFSAMFFVEVLSYRSTQIEYVFGNMFTIIIFVVPLLTMRLMSEDKKLKTDQLLLTAPLNISGVVIGKYLAACLMFLIGILPTVLYEIIMATFTTPDWNVFLGNFLAIFLLGAALAAIGLFISTLTETQMVAAIITFAIMMVIWSFDTLATQLPAMLSFLAPVLTQLSFYSRYNDFISGILNISHVLFFFSVIVIFNFLSIRILEKKRWS